MKHEIACTNNIKIQIFKIPNKNKPSNYHERFFIHRLHGFYRLFFPLFRSSLSLPLIHRFGHSGFGHLILNRAPGHFAVGLIPGFPTH